MKTWIGGLALALATPACTTPPIAEASETQATARLSVGAPAPDFSLTDLSGQPVKLSDFKGKIVVLEWFNPDCPFVRYAHDGEGPLAKRAAEAEAKGVVWLAINSGAAGKQGHGVARNQEAATAWGLTHRILMDESGQVGHLYNAKTTPQLAVVGPDGNLAYQGGLDNAPLGKAEGERVDYLNAAVDALLAGQPVATPETKPYGCSVKYGS